MAIKAVFPVKHFTTLCTVSRFLRFLFLFFNDIVQFHMPLKVTGMIPFKLTHFTLVNFLLLCLMLSIVVIKLLPTNALLTTIFTFQGCLVMGIVLVQSQITITFEPFATRLAEKITHTQRNAFV